jgi:SAM-dependent methyltransferase
MMDPDDPAYRGQADYTPRMLAIYDPWVIGFMAPVVWRCPVPPVLERYRRHLGRRHLDVGPGTGYLLEKTGIDSNAELTLLDPNPNVLAYVTRRFESMKVTTVEADVLKPLPVEGPFDSAALSFVLHCLPGPMSHKAVAIRNVARVLRRGGVLYGATVLGRSGRHTPPARAFLWAVNRRGTFDNLDDTAEGLQEILAASFETVEIDVVGSVALFGASNPR